MGFQYSLRLPPTSLCKSRLIRSRKLSQSTTTTTPAKDLPKHRPNNASSSPSENYSFNVYREVQKTRPAVRYTVYAGFALMVTVESTFWFSVLKSKFFPASSEERERAEEKLRLVWEAARGYRLVYVRNYGRYYLAYMWGLGYGGLNGLILEEDNSVGK